MHKNTPLFLNWYFCFSPDQGTRTDTCNTLPYNRIPIQKPYDCQAILQEYSIFLYIYLPNFSPGFPDFLYQENFTHFIFGNE